MLKLEKLNFEYIYTNTSKLNKIASKDYQIKWNNGLSIVNESSHLTIL